MTNHIAEMFNYHTWANQTLLGHMKTLPSTVLHQDFNIGSFKTIAHAFSHIYAVDSMWHLVLTGMSMRDALAATTTMNRSALDQLEEYEDKFAEVSEQFNQWLSSQADLEQTITLDNPYAGVRQTRLSEIMLHVINHGTYHRGNITTMLRQLGHASTMTDMALFWYMQPKVVEAG
ncbi:protein DinB [Paenibacillus sp. CCS19]|uniref:DinB family protein n=1 Tax=Paenibacillus sp. CCS19 TaxID=3158387 RepID=UPI00255F38C2|nr:DinB family protein [Paenibacillus cellulosilyticus]GMK37553.1 protein DinB [Paenibacillus cellulosilyticus]